MKYIFKFFKYLLISVLTIISLFVCFVIYNSNTGIEKYDTLEYNNLPDKVKSVFLNHSQTPIREMTLKCVDLNACKCFIQTRNYIPFPAGYFTIHSCDQTYDIKSDVTVFRFFILGGKNIYFILSRSYTIDNTKIATLSDVFTLSKVKYGRIKLE